MKRNSFARTSAASAPRITNDIARIKWLGQDVAETIVCQILVLRFAATGVYQSKRVVNA